MFLQSLTFEYPVQDDPDYDQAKIEMILLSDSKLNWKVSSPNIQW